MKREETKKIKKRVGFGETPADELETLSRKANSGSVIIKSKQNPEEKGKKVISVVEKKSEIKLAKKPWKISETKYKRELTLQENNSKKKDSDSETDSKANSKISQKANDGPVPRRQQKNKAEAIKKMDSYSAEEYNRELEASRDIAYYTHREPEKQYKIEILKSINEISPYQILDVKSYCEQIDNFNKIEDYFDHLIKNCFKFSQKN